MFLSDSVRNHSRQCKFGDIVQGFDYLEIIRRNSQRIEISKINIEVDSIDDNHTTEIIPVPLTTCQTAMEHFLKNAPEGVAQSIAPHWNGKSRGIPKVRRHAISPAFAVTYNKVQGQTLSRVVLLLATSKGSKLGNLTIEMFFVGISRVRDADHLRILPCARADLDYLQKLRFSSHVRYWYNNYDTDGNWNTNRKFILPSIEPLFRKVLVTMNKNESVNIKQYQSLANQLGISYSGKTIKQLAKLLNVWIQRFKNKTLYDFHD